MSGIIEKKYDDSRFDNLVLSYFDFSTNWIDNPENPIMEGNIEQNTFIPIDSQDMGVSATAGAYYFLTHREVSYPPNGSKAIENVLHVYSVATNSAVAEIPIHVPGIAVKIFTLLKKEQSCGDSMVIVTETEVPNCEHNSIRLFQFCMHTNGKGLKLKPIEICQKIPTLNEWNAVYKNVENDEEICILHKLCDFPGSPMNFLTRIYPYAKRQQNTVSELLDDVHWNIKLSPAIICNNILYIIHEEKTFAVYCHPLSDNKLELEASDILTPNENCHEMSHIQISKPSDKILGTPTKTSNTQPDSRYGIPVGTISVGTLNNKIILIDENTEIWLYDPFHMKILKCECQPNLKLITPRLILHRDYSMFFGKSAYKNEDNENKFHVIKIHGLTS
uniref:MMS1_N domain-containing protein n=2 Tax=Rhabditophanes sp. KR3021 TaxID=114890 RepID=A0AC35U7N7_9BILA